MANINDRINGQEYESASPLAHAVRYDRAQVKTEEQKKQARENIGCYCEAGGGGGGSSGGGVLTVHSNVDEDTQSIVLDKTAAEIFEAFQSSGVIVTMEDGSGNQDYMMITRASLGAIGNYTFVVNGASFEANAGNEYPSFGDK